MREKEDGSIGRKKRRIATDDVEEPPGGPSLDLDTSPSNTGGPDDDTPAKQTKHKKKKKKKKERPAEQEEDEEGERGEQDALRKRLIDEALRTLELPVQKKKKKKKKEKREKKTEKETPKRIAKPTIRRLAANVRTRGGDSESSWGASSVEDDGSATESYEGTVVESKPLDVCRVKRESAEEPPLRETRPVVEPTGFVASDTLTQSIKREPSESPRRSNPPCDEASVLNDPPHADEPAPVRVKRDPSEESTSRAGAAESAAASRAPGSNEGRRTSPEKCRPIGDHAIRATGDEDVGMRPSSLLVEAHTASGPDTNATADESRSAVSEQGAPPTLPSPVTQHEASLPVADVTLSGPEPAGSEKASETASDCAPGVVDTASSAGPPTEDGGNSPRVGQNPVPPIPSQRSFGQGLLPTPPFLPPYTSILGSKGSSVQARDRSYPRRVAVGNSPPRHPASEIPPLLRPTRGNPPLRRPAREVLPPRYPARETVPPRHPREDNPPPRYPVLEGPPQEDLVPVAPPHKHITWYNPSPKYPGQRENPLLRHFAQAKPPLRQPGWDHPPSRHPARENLPPRHAVRENLPPIYPVLERPPPRELRRDNPPPKYPVRENLPPRYPVLEGPPPRQPRLDNPPTKYPVRENLPPRHAVRENPPPRHAVRENPSPRQPARDNLPPRYPVRENVLPRHAIREKPTTRHPIQEGQLPRQTTRHNPPPRYPARKTPPARYFTREEPLPSQPIRERPSPGHPPRENSPPRHAAKEEPYSKPSQTLSLPPLDPARPSAPFKVDPLKDESFLPNDGYSFVINLHGDVDERVNQINFNLDLYTLRSLVGESKPLDVKLGTSGTKLPTTILPESVRATLRCLPTKTEVCSEVGTLVAKTEGDAGMSGVRTEVKRSDTGKRGVRGAEGNSIDCGDAGKTDIRGAEGKISDAGKSDVRTEGKRSDCGDADKSDVRAEGKRSDFSERDIHTEKPGLEVGGDVIKRKKRKRKECITEEKIGSDVGVPPDVVEPQREYSSLKEKKKKKKSNRESMTSCAQSSLETQQQAGMGLETENGDKDNRKKERTSDDAVFLEPNGSQSSVSANVETEQNVNNKKKRKKHVSMSLEHHSSMTLPDSGECEEGIVEVRKKKKKKRDCLDSEINPLETQSINVEPEHCVFDGIKEKKRKKTKKVTVSMVEQNLLEMPVHNESETIKTLVHKKPKRNVYLDLGPNSLEKQLLGIECKQEACSDGELWKAKKCKREKGKPSDWFKETRWEKWPVSFEQTAKTFDDEKLPKKKHKKDRQEGSECREDQNRSDMLPVVCAQSGEMFGNKKVLLKKKKQKKKKQCDTVNENSLETNHDSKVEIFCTENLCQMKSETKEFDSNEMNCFEMVAKNLEAKGDTSDDKKFAKKKKNKGKKSNARDNTTSGPKGTAADGDTSNNIRLRKNAKKKRKKERKKNNLLHQKLQYVKFVNDTLKGKKKKHKNTKCLAPIDSVFELSQENLQSIQLQKEKRKYEKQKKRISNEFKSWFRNVGQKNEKYEEIKKSLEEVKEERIRQCTSRYLQKKKYIECKEHEQKEKIS